MRERGDNVSYSSFFRPDSNLTVCCEAVRKEGIHTRKRREEGGKRVVGEVEKRAGGLRAPPLPSPVALVLKLTFALAESRPHRVWDPIFSFRVLSRLASKSETGASMKISKGRRSCTDGVWIRRHRIIVLSSSLTRFSRTATDQPSTISSFLGLRIQPQRTGLALCSPSPRPDLAQIRTSNLRQGPS